MKESRVQEIEGMMGQWWAPGCPDIALREGAQEVGGHPGLLARREGCPAPRLQAGSFGPARAGGIAVGAGRPAVLQTSGFLSRDADEKLGSSGKSEMWRHTVTVETPTAQGEGESRPAKGPQAGRVQLQGCGEEEVRAQRAGCNALPAVPTTCSPIARKTTEV